MSSVALSGNVGGTGVLTLAAPNTNTNRTLNLPDASVTLVGDTATQTLSNKTFTGTTVLSTISDGTNSTSVTNAIQGSAKAWVNFNGVTTPTIRASYNVSSITRAAVGQYTVNFTTAFADTNYATFSAMSSFNTNGGVLTAANRTTGGVSISTVSNGAFADIDTISVAVFR